MNSFTDFFGDGYAEFRLGIPQVLELETETGVGIGILSKRVAAADFRLADLRHTIRLALIGGGKSPRDAFDLVERHFDATPLVERLNLSVRILNELMFGVSDTSTEGEVNE